MATIARNFLSSGFDFAENEQLLGFRFAFFNASMTFIAIVLVSFSIYRFSVSDLMLGAIDLSYALVLLWSIWQLRLDRDRYDRIAQGVIALTFVALVASTIAGQEVNILSWYILFVIMAFIMGGWRSGFRAYLASTITLLLFMLYLPEVYTEKSVVTLVSINSLITFMIFNYDRKVLMDHLRLDEINTLLMHREHETLRVLGKVAEYKDAETAAHISRVSEYSRMLAVAHGLDDDKVDTIFFAAPFHDIGKVGIADSILLKGGKLDDDEFAIMKSHTRIGSEILANANSKYLRAGAEIAHSHHEKWDGSGYPRGLQGEDIPILGRIVAISDVFDALTTVRPYKDAWPFEKAMEYIESHSGSHFDPELVELFSQNRDEVYQIYRAYAEA